MASPTYEISGTVKTVFDVQTFPSGFTKREFVVTTHEDYPQDVKLETVKDRTALLADITEGDEVTAAFNVRGNEHNDRYFVNLQAWRLAKTADRSDAGPVGTCVNDDDNLDLGDSPPPF